MCVGGSSQSVVTPVQDTSLEPIKSKYPLTAEQKRENRRRRRLASSKRRSLINDVAGDKDMFNDGSTGASSGLGGIGDASGGITRV
tara:strand:- start:18361 stop:18618 length:258 start_codon:yes stop_codon:yes gene_type:complete